MNAAEKTTYAQQSNAASSVIICTPHSYQDVKAEVVRMENRHVVLFNIEKLSKEDLYRSLDYLAGFTDCCGGTLSKMSSNLILIAPSSISVTDESYSMQF